MSGSWYPSDKLTTALADYTAIGTAVAAASAKLGDTVTQAQARKTADIIREGRVATDIALCMCDDVSHAGV